MAVFAEEPTGRALYASPDLRATMEPKARSRLAAGVVAFVCGALAGIAAACAWSMFIIGCAPFPRQACEGGALLFAGYAMLFAPLGGLLASLLVLFLLRRRTNS